MLQIIIFASGMLSSIIAHTILGYEINQWQYWAISLPIITCATMLEIFFRVNKDS